MISLSSVTKRYGDHAAVDDVTLEVESGRTLCLIGQSGCGKSTMLRLMIGLVAPTSGSVKLDDVDLRRSDLCSLRQRFGYAIQSGGLFPHLTANANVALPARRAGKERTWIESRTDTLAEMMHLDAAALAKYPAELSGGQRQRVALMRALVLDPEVLLLDEPLGALDPLIRADLQRDLRQIFDELHKTVVLVTHDLSEAAYLSGDDIAIMHGGRVLQRGTYASLAAEPAGPFVERFVGSQLYRLRALETGVSS